MKRRLLTVFFTLSATLTVTAQNINIPDANFKNALLSHSPVIDTDNDNEISTTEASAFTGILEVSYASIANLTGIEHFVNIVELKCVGNKLTSVNLNQNTALERLSIGANQLTSLNLSNNVALKKLSCYQNYITSLNLSSNTALESLSCGVNNLTSLNVSNSASLEELFCFDNQLTSLDLSNNPVLERLNCSENFSLTNLNVSNNTSMIHLECSKGQLTGLDLSSMASLENLICNDNQLTFLYIDNGNNLNLVKMVAYNNPNLTCIQVDDSTYSTVNWPSGSLSAPYRYDSSVYFSENCGTTTINEVAAIPQIAVYPNPTSKQINFDIRANAKLTNLTGQVLFNETNVSSLDLTTLPAGIYFLTLTNNKNQILQHSKIVRE